ncbi:unnamed protein product [Withania somnifera]
MVNECFSLFREMQKRGVFADKVTMVSVISACAASGALDLGRWLHATALVNMYANCRFIEKAIEIFEAISFKDAKAWSSMIVGLAVNAFAEYALVTFSRMNKAKLEPNHVTLVGVLMACAHSGLVSEGKRYWESMIQSGIELSLEHYGCMVDLLCHSNLIDEAHSFVESMPLAPCPAILRTLLVGCKKNNILDKGEILGQHLIELEPCNVENYILLSSPYASVLSSIGVDGFMHEFVVGVWSHPEAEEIKEVLRDIFQRVYFAGHEPWIATILHNVSDEEKEIALCEQSERLAIAFDLLKTEAPTVIRIVKNLRVCRDFHEVTKIISRLYNREIIARDRVRFHRFVNGACSCRDF